MTSNPRFSHSRRALLLSAPAALLLAACGGSLIGPNGPPPQIYVLNPPFGPIADAPSVTWQLAVVRPDAPDVYDTQRIAIERNQIMDYYADAQWTDETEPLLQRLIVEAFEKSGRISAVARESNGIRPDYLLQTEVRSFLARYNGEMPIATVELVAKLVTPQQRLVIATLDSRHEVPATANSIPAAVAAFNAATSATMEEIVAWTLRTGAIAPPTESAITRTVSRPHRRRHHNR